MFRLAPDPVFMATVPLSVRGGEPVPVVFNFRHMGRKALAAFIQRTKDEGMADEAVLGAVIDTWRDVVDPSGAPVPYSPQALAQLLDDHPAASTEIWNGYLAALLDYRRGN